jgi:hypothetical protein
MSRVVKVAAAVTFTVAATLAFAVACAWVIAKSGAVV